MVNHVHEVSHHELRNLFEFLLVYLAHEEFKRLDEGGEDFVNVGGVLVVRVSHELNQVVQEP